jgi:hypothetical protein
LPENPKALAFIGKKPAQEDFFDHGQLASTLSVGNNITGSANKRNPLEESRGEFVEVQIQFFPTTIMRFVK